ncbi:Qat anti-phage system TatD family nuclease QatD [Lysobacter capsici]|uniref:Qat anti-phage system TatD family nuclease QatD n=1 Tax=Lysobacter capsici TaxID=435897 RepID=UPI0009E81601|nr:Qat anti-phage system TatD family nuclease QatD [Lysobacter capsici]
MSGTVSLVDAHCHVDLLPQWQRVLQSMEMQRQYTFAVTTTPKAWLIERDITQGFHYVRVGVGLHPQVVCDRASELSILERSIPQTRFVGEVGLDGSVAHKGSLNEQTRVLRRVLSVCAEVGDRVLSLHSLRAAGAVLDLVEESRVHEHNTLIFHWFTGSPSELKRALALGALISVNADMLRTERGRACALAAGLQRTLTETDAPFTKAHAATHSPPDVRPALDALAQCHAQDLPIVSQKIEALARGIWQR